ncbi:MAG TPA: hypothetical protein VMV46_03445 [Thermoanaerobaculia bacterium]|nr:hypothetical protein [Thermoanaerobaculia bacterium]
MSETKKPSSELQDSEIEKVSGGRWKSVQTDDDTTDTTSPSKGSNK